MMWMGKDIAIDNIPISDVIERIVQKNSHIAMFWGNAHGWAPIDAAKLLSKSRLDWQVELSHTLVFWMLSPLSDIENAQLILAWTNLGALLEGTLKWFLSVYYEDYKQEVDAWNHQKKGKIVAPDVIQLEKLRQFYVKRIWASNDGWDGYIRKVQQYRNAIHAYKNREIGNHTEFLLSVRTYLKLLLYLDSRVPYP